MSGERLRSRTLPRGRSLNPHEEFDPVCGGGGNRASPRKKAQPSYVRIRQSPDTADDGNESETGMYSTTAIQPRGNHPRQDVGANSFAPGSASMSVVSPRKRERMSPESSLKVSRQNERSSNRSIGSAGPEKVPLRLSSNLSKGNPIAKKPSTPTSLSPLQPAKAQRADETASVDVTMGTPPLPLPGHHMRPRHDLRADALASHEQVHSGMPEDTPMPNAPDVDESKDFDSISNPGEPNKELKKQPDSKPISQEQLAAEVKGIYAGLVLVEAKCVNVVKAQTEALREAQSSNKSKSSSPYSDHWQALTALHRTLLHEHHDFFLASQHPAAALTLHELASKYAMPARMWRHGIHSFLELLRQRLPDSWEYMVSFIYQAYQMMALLYETVPGFEETWIECLGDLARYRMAIEEDDFKIRQTWTDVASYWYGKASDKSPDVGRLYHHLAILARTQALFQLSLYCRSLTAAVPFPSARESILTLLEPSLSRPMYSNLRQPAPDPWFVRVIAILYYKQQSTAIMNPPVRSSSGINQASTRSLPSISQASTNFLHHLEAYLPYNNEEWRKKGTYVAICLIGGLFLFGVATSSLRELFSGKDGVEAQNRPSVPQKESLDAMETDPPSQLAEAAKTESGEAWQLTYATLSLALSKRGENKVLPHIAVMLTFSLCLAFTGQGYQLLDDDFPWHNLASYLNVMLADGPPVSVETIKSPEFPRSATILPEDYTMNGQVWIQNFFPSGFFANMPADPDERIMEYPETDGIRRERVLWLGIRLACIDEKRRRNRWLTYNSMEHQFSVSQPE